MNLETTDHPGTTSPVQEQRTRGLTLLVALLALMTSLLSFAAASLTRPASPAQLTRITPAGLEAPLDNPSQLGQWCRDRIAQGTTGLTARQRNWLVDCSALWPAATPTPSTTPTPSPSPTSTPTTSPSPSASPTPTSPPPSSGNNCLANLAGCGLPYAGNTGVPAGTALTVVNGNVTLSTPGQVYEGKDVRGCVRVTAANVTIRNSRITCGGVEAGGDYVRIRSSSTGLTVTDTEVNCGDNFGIGIGSANFTAVRVNVHHCENGFDVSSPGNVVVRDSYVHDLWAENGAHADGMQWGEGASNITIDHNTIVNENGQTSAIIMWDESGAQNNNVLITRSLLAGGGYTLYCGRFGSSSNVVITNNRFSPGQYKYADSCVAPHVTTWSGNVLDSTGQSIAGQ